MEKINLDKKFLDRTSFLKKVENAITKTLYYKLDQNWFDKEKWLDLLNKAKNGDEESYNLLNPFFFQDFNRIVIKNTSTKRIEQIKNGLEVYFNNTFEQRGKYQSFYSFKDNLTYRISDHICCSKSNYIFINKKIKVSLGFLQNENQYYFDIVINIPNFFNIDRKKEALFLILKKNKDLILKTILRHSKIIKEPYFSYKINNL
jgi:hypothetical protein